MINTLVLFILACLFWPQQSVAKIDAMELALLQPYQKSQSIHWKNISSEPLWINGVAPEYDSSWQMYVISLKTAQQSRFYLPANESLRLYNPDRKIQASDIEVYLGSGSNLFAKVSMTASIDGHSLIISPQSSKAKVISIRPAKQTSEMVKLAVMISNHQSLNDLGGYRHLKPLSGHWVWLGQKPFQVPEIYWQMQAWKTEIIEVEGPARIKLKHRLHYESQAADIIQDYRIAYQFDDSPQQWINFSVTVESRRDILVDAQTQTLGREQQAYIEIPAGKYRLKLVSDRNLYLQVLVQTEHDYLFPLLNAPELTVQSIRKQGLMAQQSILKVDALVEKMVRNNDIQSSALLGHQVLKQAALQRQDYPAAMMEANKLLAQNSFYRNLLPSQKQSSKKQFTGYFINKTLKNIKKHQDKVFLSNQHQSAALKRLGYAYFSPVVAGNIADLYELPERFSSGFLRVLVEKTICQERHFFIQFDQQPPQAFILQCQNLPVLDYGYEPKMAETALSRLPNQAKNVTLSHQFSANQKPAALISAAVHEIELPQHVRQLKIWHNDHTVPVLNLALQVRAAKPFQFSEQSYLARLNGLSKEQVFKQFTTDIKKQSSHNELQLQNEWIPLKRFLTGLYRHYKSTVAPPIAVNTLAEQSQIHAWKNKAEQAEQRHQWVDGLSYWTYIVKNSQGRVRDQAQLSQAAILARLSENYLAQTIWRYLSLYAQADIAQQAQNRLQNDYNQQGDFSALQTLAAARFIQFPNQSSLDFMTDALMQNQQYRFVLLLGLMNPSPPVETMLKAAYQLQWWQTYQQLLTQLPKKQQMFWIGLKAQKAGDYQTAIQHWQKSESKDWLLKLQQGLAIRDRLLKEGDYKELYSQWSHWQQSLPGDKIWQDASDLVNNAFGTDQLYAVERDLYSKSFRGTPLRPVSIEVMGPVKLKFSIRVLHEKADSQQQGWLHINDNQQLFRYPFFNNKVVPGLKLTGVGHYLPGNLVTLEYQVGQGLHKMELSLNDSPVLVSISRQQAELPLTILAPLQADTFLHALSQPIISETQLKQFIPVRSSSSKAISNSDLTVKSLQLFADVETVTQAEIRITQCLDLIEREKQQENQSSILFIAEQLKLRFPENERIRTMWNRISRYSQWKQVNSIANSAGIRFIDTQGWQTDSPALDIRRALITPSKVDEHVIPAKQRLLIMMSNLSSKKLQVEVLLDDLSFLPESPAQLQYQVNHQKPRIINITRSEGWKKFSLNVPKGMNQLRFSMQQPIANQFLKLRFRNNTANMTVSQERSFFISTHSEPVQAYIKGPALIRIDEWKNNKVIPRFQNVIGGWQLVTVAPDKKQKESLLRIWQRFPGEQVTPTQTRTVTRELITVPVPKVEINNQWVDNQFMFENDFQVESPGWGSWSIATDLARQNNLQEDVSNVVPEQYQEFRVEHRYFNEFKNQYWKTEAFVRAREFGSPSFSLKESLLLLSNDWPFAINLEAKGIMQEVDNKMEGLGQFKLALSQSIHFTPKNTLIPKLSWFGRYMSLKNSNKVLPNGSFKKIGLVNEVDQDLYTVYKSEHSTGLGASMLMIHKPWKDTRWTAKIKTAINENMSLLNPDYFSTEAHWKQLLGSVTLDTSYRVNFYQADEDRVNSSTRHFTKLNLNWQLWVHNQERLEINTQYDYDINNDAHSGILSFSYHFSESRGYQDFKPGAIDFRNIKQRQRLD